MLRCPADTTTPKGESSFLYHRPQPGDTDAVLLECPHHNTLLMRVRARGKTEPGKTLGAADAAADPGAQRAGAPARLRIRRLLRR